MEKLCQTCNKTFKTAGPLCGTCYHKQYYEANKEKESLRKAKYYQDNKEYIDNRSKEYEKNNWSKVSSKNMKYQKRNAEQLRQYRREYCRRPTSKFAKAKKSCKERDLTWSLTLEQYLELIKNNCHYCDSSLEIWEGCSLDRINNGIGYEIGNVLPCCGTCNNIRNTFLTVQEMEVAMKAVIAYRKQNS